MNNKLLVLFALVSVPCFSNAASLAPCAQEAFEKANSEMQALLKSGRLPNTTTISHGFTEEGAADPIIVDYLSKKSSGERARYTVAYKLTNSAATGRKLPAEIGTATFNILVDIKKTSEIGYNISCVASETSLDLDLSKHYR